MNMKIKHELLLLHSAHKLLSVSHMPVHVTDFPNQILNYKYQLLNVWPSSIAITITITHQK